MSALQWIGVLALMMALTWLGQAIVTAWRAAFMPGTSVGEGSWSFIGCFFVGFMAVAFGYAIWRGLTG